jgi:hypothetical protein
MNKANGPVARIKIVLGISKAIGFVGVATDGLSMFPRAGNGILLGLSLAASRTLTGTG